MQMVGPWGRYLPQWLRAPGNGSGPAICQHTHTHKHWTLPTTMSVLETPFDIHVSSVYQTHTCMQAPIHTLCISAKETHNKGSRTQPIMSTLMPKSGIPVICSRATLSCDSSYCINEDIFKSHYPTPLLKVTGNRCFRFLFEPHREKTGFLHMRKQRRRSASR